VSGSRFVVLTTPLTEATRGLVDDVFAAMRDDAYLVNVSRGDIVAPGALEAALNDDEIAGAAVDVFHEEPLSKESKLCSMDEVIVVPHAAARPNTYGDRTEALAATNIARLNDGGTPWNQVV
jgi:D-2-hydroxyacid dehydrogenase (NADP+)